ncbi:hypothetical protein [Caulobacter endophyticus]|uniref:hypothetical protein n=1 Tax=Caulobacter endophyticus TaxID=2172652 RepID=UPI00240F4A7C|nr:hypothetical protein [Caulobacter endophyticus]MDG2529823.1 hypothetical protein [Caulobacter endophyticus]
MRRLLLLTVLCAGGCASGVSAASGPPSARSVARIETGIATIENVQAVGVGDSARMARVASTIVRGLRCAPAEAGRFQCSYQTALRIAPNQWTPRTRTFERVAYPSPSQPQAKGWVVVEPAAR